MTGAFVVVGATGEVGRGITAVLLERGHRVVAVARDAGRLRDYAAELGDPDALLTVTGSLENDASATDLVAAIVATAGEIAGVAIAVNGVRERGQLISRTSEEFTRLVMADLTTHFVAVRAFVPAIVAGGALVGIGGGSADFILGDGAYMSVAQGGLRQMYRALAAETAESGIAVRELIVASVVNSINTRATADPLWVTEREIGAQVAAMLEVPAGYPEPIWRITRREGSGPPPVFAEQVVPVTPLPPEATPARA